MPCLKGRFPVAIEVQSIGESGGCKVAICPIAPFSTSRCTFGILPASIRGWITFQSAASHPTSITFRFCVNRIMLSQRCAARASGHCADTPILQLGRVAAHNNLWLSSGLYPERYHDQSRDIETEYRP